ncbi:MAG: class I SAM-dependent methyltransferase [Luteolibacter sp.]
MLELADVSFAGKVAVLNLACGRADETGALVAALAPAEVGFYLGVDLRDGDIDEAKGRWELPGGEIDFRVGNAAAVGRMEELPEFDLVFIRHQNYWTEPMVWEGILDEVFASLKDGGVFVSTSYFDVEHAMMLASVRTRDFEVLANVRNVHSRVLPDAEGKSVDRWMMVSRKGA